MYFAFINPCEADPSFDYMSIAQCCTLNIDLLKGHNIAPPLDTRLPGSGGESQVRPEEV